MNKVWLVFAHDDLEESGFDNHYGDVPDDSNELIGVYSSKNIADETAEALRLKESQYSDSVRYFTVEGYPILSKAQTADKAYHNRKLSKTAFVPDKPRMEGETL